MYEVYLVNDDYTVIHSAEPSDIKLLKMGLLKEINAIPVFNFSMLPNNPAYPLMALNKTVVRIVRITDRSEIFEGVINVYNGAIDTNNRTELSYSADDIIGVLRDSHQPKFTFKGKVSEFVKQLLDNHNQQVEDWKQFELGVCEVDTYRVYTDLNTPVNQVLGVGDKATIKQTTKYIWNYEGVRLNINTAVLGVTHTVEAVGASGMYLLRHPNPAWGISGWIQAEDIVEVYAEQTTPVVVEDTELAPNIARVSIKQSATVYYTDHYTNVGVAIPSSIKSSKKLTVNKNQYINGRYTLYNDGQGIARINENDIIFGTEIINPPVKPKPTYIEKERIIDVEVDYGNTWDVLMEHVIESVGGELVRTKTEGVHTLNIVNQIGIDSDLPISLEFNIQEIKEAVDASDIVTKVRGIGKPPKETDEANVLIAPTYPLVGGA